MTYSTSVEYKEGDSTTGEDSQLRDTNLTIIFFSFDNFKPCVIMQVELPLASIPQVAIVQNHLVPEQLAIHLRDVNLVSSKKNVLSGLSLSVPRGSMYGLLGPSGCGKTVLIRCILGTLKPTSGSIEVFGNQPGASHSVGYMPQHIALFPQLTIRETFNYFGSIYGLDGAQVNENCLSLVESLHLPTQTDQLVELLSGDQKRRFSLAIALIHKPKLLILDEPTRGMDPLIRNFVWGHLVDLSLTDHLTVLVNSDYFEDVKDAKVVGFMRHGQILAQDSPSALLDRFHINTLEQAFLPLCTRAEVMIGDDVNPSVEQVGAPEVSLKISSTTVESFPEVVVVVEDSAQQQPTESIDEMSHGFSQMDSVTDIPIVSKCTQMVAMVTKNFRTLYRNKLTFMIFQFGFPTVLVILFCFLCIGSPDDLQMSPIPVAVYNGDHSRLSIELINKLNPSIVNLQMYNSENDAINAVRMGKASTALVICDNFYQCYIERFVNDNMEEDILRNSTIHLYPSLPNQLITLTSVYEEVVRYFDPVPFNSHWKIINVDKLKALVSIEKPIHREPVPTFSNLSPGTVSTIAFFCAIPLTMTTLLTEKKNGLIERTLVSGVSYFHILLSHLIPQTVILFLQMMSLVAILFPLFRIPFHFQYLLALSLLFLQSVCGMCLGLFVSTIARDGNIAIMLVLGFFYLNLMLNGTVFSIGSMIYYVIAGYLFEVICAFSVTLFWSVIFLLAAIWMARFCL